MRCIVTYSPGGRLLDEASARRAAGGDAEQLRKLGWSDANSDVPLFYVKSPSGSEPVFQHPEKMREKFPDFSMIVDEFQLTFPREIDRLSYERWSAKEVEAWTVMYDAWVRETELRQKELRNG